MRKFKFFLSILLALAIVMPVGVGSPVLAADEKPRVEYVNTLIGCINGGGATIAGPTMPNGSIHPSPETRTNLNGGYRVGQPVIGFAQLFAQGTGGTQSYGNFMISPQTNATIQTSESSSTRSSPVSNEIATANYYSATLTRFNIKTEVAPTENAAIYRFTFPASADSSIMLDISRKTGGTVSLRSGTMNIDNTNRIITGGGTFDSNWNTAQWNMYFAMEYDTAPSVYGTFSNTTFTANSTAINYTRPTLLAPHVGAYLRFSTTADQVVNVKMAISFESIEKAKSLLADQIPDWDFEAVKDAAGDAWNDILGKVDIPGATEAQKEKFYTALFHANVQPRNRVSDHGEWDDYYTIWDSWKTVYPFQNLVRSDMVASTVNSMISRYNKNLAAGSGYISDAYIQGKEFSPGQGGNDVENIIVDAYLKNIPGIDWEAAYAAVKGNSESMRTPRYVSQGYQHSTADSQKVAQNGMLYTSRLRASSATQGFAYNDYAIGQMAKGLGKLDDYYFYSARSSNWENIWDPNMAGTASGDTSFRGFAHNKNASGVFENQGTNPTGGRDRDYYEASTWTGSYYPVFDADRLVTLMGGREKFVERLDHTFTRGHPSTSNSYIDIGNEPAFQTLWLFCSEYVRRPDLSSKWAASYLSSFPQNGYPGDEDNGAMSTIYMFMMSGFFPYSCTNTYYLHGGRLPEVTYHLANGKAFTIRNVNASAANIYVQSATLNGAPLNDCWITYDQIMAGGELEFIMGSAPSKWSWFGDLIFNTALSVDGKKAKSIGQGFGKTLTASISPVNNSSDPVDVVFIAALYNASGKLCDIVSSEKKSIVVGCDETFTVNMNIPISARGYSYKLFIWEYDSYVPLCAPVSLD